jgi:hypothetical protein
VSPQAHPDRPETLRSPVNGTGDRRFGVNGLDASASQGETSLAMSAEAKSDESRMLLGFESLTLRQARTNVRTLSLRADQGKKNR